MNKIVIIVLVVVLVFVLFMFKNKKSEVRYKEANDPGILEAKIEAQSKIGDFIKQLNNNKDPNIAFNIKAPFKEDEEVEHMWVLVNSYKEGSFSGTLNNDPESVKNIKNGDTVIINESDVEDWIISNGTEMTGGFSIKLFKK